MGEGRGQEWGPGRGPLGLEATVVCRCAGHRGVDTALSHGRLSTSPPLSSSQCWSALRGEPFRFPSLSSPSFPRFCNQGLTVSPPLQNYEHLFKVNDKSVGGSFYLQSKVSTGGGQARASSHRVSLTSGQFRAWQEKGAWGLGGPPELPVPASGAVSTWALCHPGWWPPAAMASKGQDC